ncbi:MAG: hypothetical protein KatS3mg057_2313 [Herpetosiphonaceae bacterium]|nr:MAG: hypothetical protein KatS3mg057_2313 [Herpetosiphonaceae bacterium]
MSGRSGSTVMTSRWCRDVIGSPSGATVKSSRRAIFSFAGPAPPAGGRLDLGQIELYQHQGRHLLPCQTRRCLAQALGVTLIYRDLPQGALVHAVWYYNWAAGGCREPQLARPQEW